MPTLGGSDDHTHDAEQHQYPQQSQVFEEIQAVDGPEVPKLCLGDYPDALFFACER